MHGRAFAKIFSSMTCHVFTYGSLMFPKVWEKVVRGRYRRAAAVLAGHARYAIVDACYPGMVRKIGASVEGVLYFDVDQPDLARLDAFEGAEYRRGAVSVRVPDGAQVQVETYLYIRPQRLLSTEWDAANFDISDFLRTYCPTPELPI